MTTTTTENAWLQYIIDHPERVWAWPYISQNQNITWEDVQKHQRLPWDFYELSRNPNITKEIMENYPEHGWNKDAKFEINYKRPS